MNIASWRGRRGTRRAAPPPTRSCWSTSCGCSARTTRTPCAPEATSPPCGGRPGIDRAPLPTRSCWSTSCGCSAGTTRTPCAPEATSPSGGGGGGPGGRRGRVRGAAGRPAAGARPGPPGHPAHPEEPRHLAGEGGDPAGAAGAYEELLADQLRVLGPDHPDTLRTQIFLPYWRGRRGTRRAPIQHAARLAESLAVAKKRTFPSGSQQPARHSPETKRQIPPSPRPSIRVRAGVRSRHEVESPTDRYRRPIHFTQRNRLRIDRFSTPGCCTRRPAPPAPARGNARSALEHGRQALSAAT